MGFLRVIWHNRTIVVFSIAAFIATLLGLSWASMAGCTEDAVKSGQCPTPWLWGNPFWSNFYGNLMSTIAGAALGFWAALWLNGKAEGERRQAEREGEERRRQDQVEAEARQRQSVLDAEALRREREMELDARRRQDERNAEARQRQAERDAEERQRQQRQADDLLRRRMSQTAVLNRRAAVMGLILHEVRRIREFLDQLAPAMLQDKAIQLSVSTDAWTGLLGDALPGLMDSAEGIEVAQSLTNFYSILKHLQGPMDTIVLARAFRRVLGHPPIGPTTELAPMAENLVTLANLARDLEPRLEYLIADYQQQALELGT